MVTARLAIGSVSTLALAALVLGSASYWLNRSGTGSHASPWGVVSALGAAQTAAARPDDERAQLLKLAALKSGAAAEPASTVAPSAPANLPAVAPAPAAPVPVAESVVAPAPSQAPEATVAAASPPATPATAVSAEPIQQVASAEAAEPVDAAPAPDEGTAKSDRININTASPSALDHLPGAGRIGRTIVSHRPYKSVKELVSRRVLRTSDFQKIQSRISVD